MELIFVLVLLTSDGSMSEWAQFPTFEACEAYARPLQATMQHAQVACLPRNVATAADLERDFGQAIDAMTRLQRRMAEKSAQ